MSEELQHAQFPYFSDGKQLYNQCLYLPYKVCCKCRFNISNNTLQHLWERFTSCIYQGQWRTCLQANLKTDKRKFSSGYFNSVYSCLDFLFPVVLNTLPVLPFLLFLKHYCPLPAKKGHSRVIEEYFLTRLKQTSV